MAARSTFQMNLFEQIAGAAVLPTSFAVAAFLSVLLAPMGEGGDLLTTRALNGLVVVSIPILALWLGLRLALPIRNVASRTLALARGDVHSPVPSRGRGDEIDRIADGLQAIAATMRELEASHRRTLAINKRLSRRLDERTADLAASEDRLRTALAHGDVARRELVLRDRLASLGALVPGLAHELNTPLGNARTCASLLAREIKALGTTDVNDAANATARLERVAELLERSLDRAVELITTFKQVSVDQASAQRRIFQLHDAVRALHDTVAPKLRRTPVRLRVTVPIDIQLDSYPGPLEQALFNLVNNAVVHAFEDRTTGTVEIRAEAEGERVRITVEDDGHGIPVEQQPFVFDPFFTTKMGKGGSGLGLHMVHSTVTGLLGGQVSIDSVPDRGTRVILEIPAVAPVSQAA